MTMLVEYQPWNLLSRLRNGTGPAVWSSLARDFSGGESDSQWYPAVDVKETADACVIQLDLPGVDPDNIEIMREKGVLTIKGERHLHPVQEEATQTIHAERVSGTFCRRFSLADDYATDRINARCNNGVLEVHIPRQEQAQPRRIQVQS